MMPPGIATASVRRTKPGLARSRFGARLSRKAGMPMVNQPMTVIWSGRNGPGRCSTPMVRAISTA